MHQTFGQHARSARAHQSDTELAEAPHIEYLDLVVHEELIQRRKHLFLYLYGTVLRQILLGP